MSLESANYIWELVDTNPQGSDPLSQADDHMRMIKRVLPASFPGMTAPWTTTERIKAGNPVDPQDLVTLAFLGSVGNASPIGIPFIWLLDALPVVSGLQFAYLDGSAIDRVTYAALFAMYGVKYGAGNGTTTFNLPDWRGYFWRTPDAGSGRDPDAATRTARADGANTNATPGTTQIDQNKSHTHGYGTLHNLDPGSNGSLNNIAGGALQTQASGGAEARPKNIYTPLVMRIL